MVSLVQKSVQSVMTYKSPKSNEPSSSPAAPQRAQCKILCNRRPLVEPISCNLTDNQVPQYPESQVTNHTFNLGLGHHASISRGCIALEMASLLCGHWVTQSPTSLSSSPGNIHSWLLWFLMALTYVCLGMRETMLDSSPKIWAAT